MTHRPARRLALALLALPPLLAACAAPPAGPAAAPFGAATRAALARQIADPDAARKAGAADGVDGAAAAQAQRRYQKSFAEPQGAPGSYTIGVSGGK